MIQANEILSFIEIENVKKKKDFIKSVTNDKTKQAIFNDRFFDGKSFTASAYEIGISEAMAKHIYKEMIKAIEAHIYLHERLYEYKENGNNQGIIIAKLPLSNRIKSRLKHTFLHEISELNQQDFWSQKGCGEKCMAEIRTLMIRFGLRFADHGSKLEKIYALKK